MNNYFTFEEFDSPDELGSGQKYMSTFFLAKLTEARIMANVPFKITSGYRTPKHNKKVGGVANSSHLKGVACDIAVSDSQMRSKILTALIRVGFNRIGIAKNFIHVDIDKDKSINVIWTY